MAGSNPASIMRRQNAIPTNMIIYKGRQMPARIDPEARVGRIVEVMCGSFSASEHHITLCLRDEEDVLVTQANLPAKVHEHVTLKLVSSPMTEALTVVNSLKYSSKNASLNDSTASLPDQAVIPLKLALFNLSKFIKEEEFAAEFMIRGGVKMLIELLERREGGLSGNSLAYALQGVRGIMEFESGWEDLSDNFIDRCLQILTTASQPNVLRPATAIIRKLVISSPQVDRSQNRKAQAKGKSKAKEKNRESFTSTVTKYGFDKIYLRMESWENGEVSDGALRVLRVVVKRLEGAGDLELVAQSLGLINVCLRVALQENSPLYANLVANLEALGVRRSVSRLIPMCINNTVEPQILNFQARYAAVLQYRRHVPVRPDHSPGQQRMLSDIYEVGRLGHCDSIHPDAKTNGHTRTGSMQRSQQSDDDAERNMSGWGRIGPWLDADEPEDQGPSSEGDLFRDVGELGLECLHWFVMHEENFHNLVMEQEAKVAERRFPFGRASAECVKTLCEHYNISQAGHHPPSHFQLFLLNFPRLHSLVLRFFMRMWQESESRLPDFGRLSLLVRSQVQLSLAEEAIKTWLHLERDFLDADYRTIRDRQMEQLEKEDGMLNLPTVRALREQVGREAYDVLAEQRIGCMLQGSWFNSASVLDPSISPNAKATSARPLRFVRLSPNRRTLAWGEYVHREPVNPSYDSLRERIDLANVTDLRLATGCAVGSRSPNLVSKLSFSLMSGPELSLLDLDAVHAAQLAEWTDGLRVLRGEGGMGSQETATYVHILGEMALKVHLLDITGDGVDLPEKLTFAPAPKSVDFWFAK